MTIALPVAAAALYAAAVLTGVLVPALRTGAHRAHDETGRLTRRHQALVVGAAVAAAICLAAHHDRLGVVLTIALVSAIPLYALMAAIDIDVHRLPDRLTLTTYIGALLAITLASATTGDWAATGRALAGSAVSAGLLTAMNLLSRGQLGPGDAKLAASLTLYLTWHGWAPLGVMAFGSLALALFPATYLIATGRGRHSSFALGPCIIIASVGAALTV